MFKSRTLGLKEEVVDAILVDDLDKARFLLNKADEELGLLTDLLAKAGSNTPPPLNWLRSDYPQFVHIPTSFTCNMGCEMCNVGFHDRSALYDDYKYMLPSEFDNLSSWISTGTYIRLIGQGETLDSPHIPYFLEKLTNKTTIITTNGTPLNRKKITEFVQLKLDFLVFSFDGKTTLGHGGGSENYIRKFWGKVEMTQKIKEELGSKLPKLIIIMAINAENISNLDEVFATARQNSIEMIDLTPMIPRNADQFKKSIFQDYEASKKAINSIISRWRRKGMDITFCLAPKMEDSTEPCHFVDNFIVFGLPRNHVCCGSITIPLAFSDYSFSNHSKETTWNSFPLRYLRYLHFCSDTTELPSACKTCPMVNIKECASTTASFFNSKQYESEDHALYCTASQLKQDGKIREAEKKFLTLLQRQGLSSSLIGKIYFHLGELQVKTGDYLKAMHHMKLAVQHCFNHKMAFAYLYLLLKMMEEPQTSQKRKSVNSSSLEKMSQLAFR